MKYILPASLAAVAMVAVYFGGSHLVFSKSETQNEGFEMPLRIQTLYSVPPPRLELLALSGSLGLSALHTEVSNPPESGERHVSPPQGVVAVRKKYGEFIQKVAKKNGFQDDFVLAIILVESGGNKNATSSTGAEGLMQITEAPLKELDVGKVDLYNPKTNIRIGVSYLARIRDHYGYNTLLEIAVAYNAGPGAARSMTSREIKRHFYAQRVSAMLKNL